MPIYGSPEVRQKEGELVITTDRWYAFVDRIPLVSKNVAIDSTGQEVPMRSLRGRSRTMVYVDNPEGIVPPLEFHMEITPIVGFMSIVV